MLQCDMGLFRHATSVLWMLVSGTCKRTLSAHVAHAMDACPEDGLGSSVQPKSLAERLLNTNCQYLIARWCLLGEHRP